MDDLLRADLDRIGGEKDVDTVWDTNSLGEEIRDHAAEAANEQG